MNEEARICGISLNKLSIFNVYVPNGNPVELLKNIEFKLQWLEELSKMVKNIFQIIRILLLQEILMFWNIKMMSRFKVGF